MGPPAALKLTLEETLARAEKQILLETLETYNWNRQRTARVLDISRTTLFNKMRRFFITNPRRRPPAPKAAEPKSELGSLKAGRRPRNLNP